MMKLAILNIDTTSMIVTDNGQHRDLSVEGSRTKIEASAVLLSILPIIAVEVLSTIFARGSQSSDPLTNSLTI